MVNDDQKVLGQLQKVLEGVEAELGETPGEVDDL